MREMDVEKLVSWALSEQGLGFSAVGRAGLDFAELGTRVDVSIRGSIASPSAALMTDPDALLVRMAIDGMAARPAAALLIQYGRIADRPDWCEEGAGEWVQDVDGRGRPLWDWEDPRNHRSPRRPKLVFKGHRAESVTWYRAQYQLWWMGLHDLVDPLNRALKTHRAQRPAVAFEPWLLPQGVTLMAG